MPDEFRNTDPKISTYFPKTFFGRYTSRYDSDQTYGAIGKTLISQGSLYNFASYSINTFNKNLGFIYAMKPSKILVFSPRGLIDLRNLMFKVGFSLKTHL